MNTTGRKTVKGGRTTAPKAVRSNEAAAVAPAAKRILTSEQVAKRSYELFLARGGEHGHDVEDWLQAERELAG